MTSFEFDDFKRRYEIFAYISVYAGYYVQLFNIPSKGNTMFYITIFSIAVLIIMHKAFLNPVIIIPHCILFLIFVFEYLSFNLKIVYFLFMTPFLSIILYMIFSIFGLEDKIEQKNRKKKLELSLEIKRKSEQRIELEKQRKQDEWNNLPQDKKDIILNENKRNEREKARRILKEMNQRILDKKNVENLAKEKRLRDIRIKEENEEKERIKQLILIQEKETKEKDIAEKRIMQLQEQKEKRDEEFKEETKRKILEKERKKQLESEAIQELIDAGLTDNNHYSGNNIRKSIPPDVKIAVWQRDKERCVTCFSNTNLEFDHIIPVSKGGANSIKNIQLLCRNCNRTKSNKII